MNLFCLVILPILAGLVNLFLKGRQPKSNLLIAAFSISFICAVVIFIKQPQLNIINLAEDYNLIFGVNKISRVILIFINLFGLLNCFYSKNYMEDKRGYFSYLAWLIAFSNLAVFSMDFISFIFGWGVTLVLLYALLNLGTGSSARKAFSIVGFADFSLLLGICLYVAFTGYTLIPENAGIVMDRPIIWVSFILMLIGALTKAGSGPFHTWIPDAAADAPIPVMAILPASLDKLLGIYLLARICVDFFAFNLISQGILLLVGALTIIFAVMLALIQHDLRKLLSYHAISQVGYMVLGFGTGLPIGIVAGIFHMINNSIYKTGLFFIGGIVGKEKKTFELDSLGGLAVFMPISFICALVFALSISGVPLFNGFVSKWLLYQGVLLGFFASSNILMRAIFIFALVAAMFGSALTLASFIKFIHAIFLGQDSGRQKEKVKEASLSMLIPNMVLALLCIAIGFVPNLFLRVFIEPWFPGSVSLIGNWNSVFTIIFVAVGLIIGLFIWMKLNVKKRVKQDSYFIGGETTVLNPEFPATEFYKGVQGLAIVNKIYGFLNINALDFYNVITQALKFLGYCLFFGVDRLAYILVNVFGYLVLGLSWFLKSILKVITFKQASTK